MSQANDCAICSAFQRLQIAGVSRNAKCRLQVVGRATEKVKTTASSQVSADAWYDTDRGSHLLSLLVRCKG